MSNTVISIENLSKSYRLGMIGGATLKEDVARWWAKRRGRPDPFTKIGSEHHARLIGEEYWALQDVSFKVKEGEVLGIIGRNGAGKSTLLKILSQVTAPTSGEIKIKGRIGSLLEVGTGFHQELSGRENIFLNGAILGMTKGEIRRKLDEIIDFSGIEEFIDTPVKRYSSGMYVRLAFAVAAHLEPEILIVDEVLAVGDFAFQKKCLGKMQDVSRGGRTVLFVSHTMQAVRTLCTRCVWLSNGELKANGPVDRIVDDYQSSVLDTQLDVRSGVRDQSVRRGDGAVRIAKLQITDESNAPRSNFEPGETILFHLEWECFRDVSCLLVSIALRGGKSSELVASSPHLTICEGHVAAGRKGTLTLQIPDIPFRPGDYPLYLWLGDKNANPFDVVDGWGKPLTISTDKSYDELGYDPSAHSGFVTLPLSIKIGASTKI